MRIGRLYLVAGWFAALAAIDFGSVFQVRAEAAPSWSLAAVSPLLDAGLAGIVVGALLAVVRQPSLRVAEAGLALLGAGFLPLAAAALLLTWSLQPAAAAAFLLTAVLYAVWSSLSAQRRAGYTGSWEVPAPPERVFALATDPAAYERLYAGAIRGAVVGGGPLAAGARIQQITSTGKRGEDEVLEYDPPRLMRSRALGLIGLAEGAVSCTAAGTGTLLNVTFDILLPPLATLVITPRSRQATKRREAWAQRLIGELTAEPGAYEGGAGPVQ